MKWNLMLLLEFNVMLLGDVICMLNMFSSMFEVINDILICIVKINEIKIWTTIKI